MKNKLHIFGCSHSMFDRENLNNRIGVTSDIEFWGKHIADNFNLDLFGRTGHSGRNVEYILFDIFDRILSNQIQKNDLVILNTSYPLRFGTPRLQSYSKHPLDHYDDIKTHIKISFDNMESLDDLKPEITFILWYVQTFGAWKLLNSVCDNVYQWCLNDVSLMDELYIKGRDLFFQNDTNEIYSQFLGIDKYTLIKTTYLNEWKNLIKPPNNLETWNDWIQTHPIDNEDTHLHPIYYKEFAELFIQQINYLND